MNDLIEKVKQWGVDKGITGPNGKGTPVAQALKMMEEADETLHAVRYSHDIDEVKDGIGDTCVTLILLAEMYRLTLEECLEHAYQIIAKRTGKMEGGTFVKDEQ